MRIAVCGIHIESSTFTEHVTTRDDFEVRRGDEVLALFPLDEWAPGVEFVGILTANAGAAGPIQTDVYDALENEMAQRLRDAGPVDGVWLEMHGAAHVQGRRDAEEHWLRRVREIVGAEPILSGSFDTHGNMSEELVRLLDLAAFHRHAPHIDSAQTRERAVRNLVSVVKHGGRPHKAWVRIPVLLPGERTSTVVEPAKTVFGQLLPTIDKHNLIDAAMCVGFFWADEPRNAAGVFTSAWHADDAVTAAESLAKTFWEHRKQFQIVSEHYGTLDEALDFALTRPARPLFVSDSGDNVTAGATGDITYAIHHALKRHDILDSSVRILFGGVWDPETVQAAADAGEGAVLRRGIGALVDSRYGAPVDGEWTVLQILLGPDSKPTEAVLRGNGVDVTVRSNRAPFARTDDAGFPPGIVRGPEPIDIAEYDVVVVKNGYLFPAQAEDAGSAFMAITPGGTDLDHGRLEYTAISRPLYPWDETIDANLTARLVPAWTADRAEAN
ncbi:microcystin degradation protein MlrC [Streptomyces sp. SID8361]|uniref:M81 family metallopeptidase n=1 Tax=Streptomyces sp. MnatMP-M27 TaxID=1839768 RepID=UPI00081F6EB6|nr:M81 family metallopeptidase [Streptomyces sp. MnatMP-M27]MYU10407.1 microcystin degradation protein MlrC [Streptomyces sp. SID8361]SCF71665.1 Microcystin degradation protein MlrC, contains DUF1485 domain [Streptomyces sp. MnatMP-M27]